MADNVPYRWEQTHSDVRIFVDIDHAIKAKDVVYKLTHKAELQLGVKGHPPLIDEKLWGAVKVDDSLFEIETVDGKRALVVTLVKTPQGKEWDFLLLSQVRVRDSRPRKPVFCGRRGGAGRSGTSF